MQKGSLILSSTLFIAIMSFCMIAHSQPLPPNQSIIDKSLINKIKSYLTTDVVIMSITNQNKKHKELSEKNIKKLDQKWRKEHKTKEKPLISAILSNPLSSYLTRIQAHSIGLYTEIFIMDNKGLNVGQSNISSDFWQGDEAKWQKTYLKGPKALFIDKPEWNKETQTWRSQANLAIANPNTNEVIGAATFEINLTELKRRRGND